MDRKSNSELSWFPASGPTEQRKPGKKIGNEKNKHYTSMSTDRREERGAGPNMFDFHDRTEKGERKPCRACTDVDSFLKMYGKRRSAMTNGQKSSESQNVTSSESDVTHVECPLDREELGRNTWSFLHSMAAYYPDKPTQQQQSDMKNLIHQFSKFYPCDHCAEDFRESIKKAEPQTQSQQTLSKWMCDRHNEVNRKLGKPEFDCSRVTERWRDGWKDGSCD